MVKVDRCGWCKHFKEIKNGKIICDAFPNGTPDYFNFPLTSDCTSEITFEAKPEEEKIYNELFSKPRHR